MHGQTSLNVRCVSTANSAKGAGCPEVTAHDGIGALSAPRSALTAGERRQLLLPIDDNYFYRFGSAQRTA
jgi:hypothetical protein